MSNGMPFTPSTEMTAIALAYRNTRLIADEVCPRSTVGKKNFKYTVFNTAERFTVPETRIGRKSAPNQVEFTADSENGSVKTTASQM